MTNDEKLGLILAEAEDFMNGTMIFPGRDYIKQALADYRLEVTDKTVDELLNILRKENKKEAKINA